MTQSSDTLNAGRGERKPLDAEYIRKVHAAAKRALGDVTDRRLWADSKWGSPVAAMTLCGEIARLNIINANMLAVLNAVHRPYERLTDEALEAGVLMEYGPPNPEKGAALLLVRRALATPPRRR